ncbi:MAG: hypothetical protein M1825_000524 [Sarcosagium campestre]|nr:MAG: hypothetical protein M1825_000524 [Sarcosagium campestre]
MDLPYVQEVLAFFTADNVSSDNALNFVKAPPFAAFAASYGLFLVAEGSYRVFWPERRLTFMGRSPFFLLNLLFALAGALFYSQSVLSQVPTSTFLSTTITEDKSTSRAIFTVPPQAELGAKLLPNLQDPDAVDAQLVCPGYTATDVRQTKVGLTAELYLAGAACNAYGTDVDRLSLTVEYQSKDRLHVQILPVHIDSSNLTQYVLPENLVRKPVVEANASAKSADNDIRFDWGNEPSFHFSVIRQSTGDVLFSSRGKKLVFENQFVEFASELPQEYNLYGLGEVMHGLRLGNNLTRTFWAADIGDPLDDNLYGSHPFYLDTRYYKVDPETGSSTLVTTDQVDSASKQYKSLSHGVYLRNAHAQEVLLRAQNITWRTLGGSIDLYFFAGPSAPEVTKSYQKDAIGLPALQQYFTFGYHQCRWGYHNWSEVEQLIDDFEKFQVPLDNIWLDIDYMNQYRDFDNDLNTFPYEQGQRVLKRLHDGGRHLIPIVDSAIYIPNPLNRSDSYETFDRGKASDVFMKNPDGSLYIGAVWPGYTVFPDWLAEGANRWWSVELQTWYKKVPYDGIWIDMSEVSSFCVGSCGSQNLTLNPVHPPFQLPGEPGAVVYDYPEGFEITNATEAKSAASLSSSQSSAIASATTTPLGPYLKTIPTPHVRDVNHPPYVINNVQGDLAVHAMSPNATHADGTADYEMHNLYGHLILNATYHALLDVFPGKRPFIIGRSTFAGSGTVAGHWGGDNYSRWAYMFFSIPQALSFSLFGIPMFGVDTCGFSGNADAELCSRWMQLSAFFPFYRNHNTLSAHPQEPYVWSSVLEASKTAMSIRYALLPYMYTLFYHAHAQGSTVMRALAWEFPSEPALAAADRQFLLGPSLLVTPVLTPGATTVDGVFPGVAHGEIWYDWYAQRVIKAEPGKNTTIDAPLGHIPLFVRGGAVLPMQEPALTTRAAKATPWSLLVALRLDDSAEGSLYVDDGESVEPDETLNIDFIATAKSLTATKKGSYKDTNPLATVTILGIRDKVNSVSFNDEILSGGGSESVRQGEDKDEGEGWSYDAEKKVLRVTGLKGRTVQGAWAADWTLTWQ